MKRKKLFWQLYPASLLIAIVSIISITLFANHTFKRFYQNETEKNLLDKANLLESSFTLLLATKQFEKIQETCFKLKNKTKTRITVILPDGTVVGDSSKKSELMDNHKTRIEIYTALNGNIGKSLRFSPTLKTDHLYLAIPLKSANDIIGVLRTSMGLNSIQQPLFMIHQYLIIAILVLTLIIIVVNWILSRWISRPLELIKIHAGKYASGDFSKKIQLGTSESQEIKLLSIAMNEMGDQINNKIKTITKQKSEKEAILSSMIEGVLTVDREGKISHLNQATADLFDLNSIENCNGKMAAEAIRNHQVSEIIKTILKDERFLDEEIKIDGNKTIKIHGTPLSTLENNNIGALLIFNDITQICELNDYRKQFVSNVSHELKTPLTSIQGYIETILDGKVTKQETINEFMLIIKNNADRLRTIIEDLLTISRIENEDENSLETQVQPLAPIIGASVAYCEKDAKNKKISVDIECDKTIQANVNSHLLEQALINLINNAIKYSAVESQIKIKAGEQDMEIFVSVDDNGIGIASEHFDRIFERFYTVDKARSRKLGGSGLGLSIVKHISLSLNGYVKVASKLEKGSTFTIYLPK